MKDFAFEDVTDLHVDTVSPTEQSVLFPGQVRVQGDAMVSFVNRLADEIRAIHKANPGRNRFTVKGDIGRFRVQHMMADKYAVRVINDLPSFDKHSFSKPHVAKLCSEDYLKTGGLIMIVGPAGSGKTSTAVSTLRKRLEMFGGFALTVEDPPEYDLRGFVGEDGYCEQLDVTEIGFEKGLEISLRSFPSKNSSMLFFGEVRSKAAAAELLRIAVDGHLVITTLHAKDIPSAITRLISMASNDGEDEARYLLAQSLKLVIHQQIDEQNIVKLEALDVDSTASSIIRNPQAEMNLTDCIRRTKQMLNAARTA
ncbi:ATPase, T2SS/T4P/T4SS family [Methylobacillus sp. Pita2]|uniref:ATPase, T2SS/T4P/T4SS family n=1 Tax=Methylobacillus sp. Pita2 TaxID=3383245 RepID=UPI0038B4760C